MLVKRGHWYLHYFASSHLLGCFYRDLGLVSLLVGNAFEGFLVFQYMLPLYAFHFSVCLPWIFFKLLKLCVCSYFSLISIYPFYRVRHVDFIFIFEFYICCNFIFCPINIYFCSPFLIHLSQIFYEMSKFINYDFIDEIRLLFAYWFYINLFDISWFCIRFTNELWTVIHADNS